MPPITPIYLDYASTTPLADEVREAMHAAEKQARANPASQHQAGRAARRILENAREEILLLLDAQTTGMQADQLIFTSGGTEANHLALLGMVPSPGERVLLSSVEHSSIRGAAEILTRRGYRVEFLQVNQAGVVDVSHLQTLLALEPKPRLVSIMLVNNETGVIQPIREIAQLCREQQVLLHTDAVQAIGKMPVSFRELDVDAMTIAPHKFHGPLGIGGLIVRHAVPLEAQLRGGFQQAGLRAGTESIVLAVGFATALREAHQHLSVRQLQLASLQANFEQRLANMVPEIEVNGHHAPRSGHISNVAFLGVDRQKLFLALDMAGVYCSTGSACASGSSEPSPVLLAMGLKQAVVESSIRFSFSPATTLSEVETAVERISKCVNKLRRQ